MYPILILQSETVAARRRIPIWLVDATDGIVSETGVTGTPRISKNGGASAAAATTITEVDSTNMPGLYYIELSATEVDTLGTVMVSFKTAATGQWHGICHVVDFDPFDGVRMGMTALPNAAAEAAGGLFTRGTGAGQINQPANGLVDVNVEQWLDSVVNALASGRVDASVGAMAADVVTATAIANAAIDAATFAAGAINAAALATDAVDEIVDQVWNELRSGHVGAGSFGEGVASVQGAVTGSVASVSGAVGSISAGGIAAAAFVAGALDAAALNADAAAEIADAVWDENIEAAHGTDATAGLLLRAIGAGISNRANNATLDALLGVADAAGVDLPDQVLDGDTLAELGQAIPAATPTLRAAIMLLYMAFRNKRDVTSGLDEVHDDAGVIIATAVLTDDATTFSRAEMIAGT